MTYQAIKANNIGTFNGFRGWHMKDGIVDPRSDFMLAKARREHFNAKLAELDYLEREKKLVFADRVEKEAFAMARNLRNKFQGLPAQLGERLANLNDRVAVESLLADSIRDILAELSD